MRRRSSLLLSTALTTLVVGMAVASAGANRLSVSEQSFTETWASLTLEAAGSTVRCPVTLRGSFASSTIVKVHSMLIARYGEGRVGSCTGGSVTLLTETLPWHKTFEHFFGRLPRVTGIGQLIVQYTARITIEGGISCLMATTTSEPGALTANVNEAGEVTSTTLDESVVIDLADVGGFLCDDVAGDVRMSGTGSVVTGARAPQRIRLI